MSLKAISLKNLSYEFRNSSSEHGFLQERFVRYVGEICWERTVTYEELAAHYWETYVTVNVTLTERAHDSGTDARSCVVTNITSSAAGHGVGGPVRLLVQKVVVYLIIIIIIIIINCDAVNVIELICIIHLAGCGAILF